MSRLKKKLLLRGRLFIPYLFSWGAVLEGMPIEDYLGDPNKITNATRALREYFELDCAVCYHDRAALAEDLGAEVVQGGARTVVPLTEFGSLEQRLGQIGVEGRTGVAVEVTRRLCTLLPQTLLIAVIPGPVLLAMQLTGATEAAALERDGVLGIAGKACLAHLRALGEAQIDLVIIQETLPEDVEASPLPLRRLYGPIGNTGKFYDCKTLLQPESAALAADVQLIGRTLDGVIHKASSDPAVWTEAGKRAFSLPATLLSQGPEAIQAFFEQTGLADSSNAGRLFLLTTDDDVPESVGRAAMLNNIKTAQELLKK